jgi:hypothetical protein
MIRTPAPRCSCNGEGCPACIPQVSRVKREERRPHDHIDDTLTIIEEVLRVTGHLNRDD